MVRAGDIDFEQCKIFVDQGKGQKCYRQHLRPYVLVEFMLRWFRSCLLSKHLLDFDRT